MKLSQTTTPGAVVEPVSLADLRDHLRIEHGEDDAYLISLGIAARQAAENHIDAVIAARAFLVTLDAFPSEIELPLAPIQPASIAIQYYDAAAALQTFTAFDYCTVNDTVFLHPDAGASWPATGPGKARVRVAFTAGHADTPKAIEHAIKMIVSTLYDQRRDVSAQNLTAVPMSSCHLLEPFKRSVL